MVHQSAAIELDQVLGSSVHLHVSAVHGIPACTPLFPSFLLSFSDATPTCFHCDDFELLHLSSMHVYVHKNLCQPYTE